MELSNSKYFLVPLKAGIAGDLIIVKVAGGKGKTIRLTCF